MSVRVNIRPFLTHFTKGQTVVEVEGNTVGQCLDELVKQFPKTKKVLFNKDGGLHNYVEVYINRESAHPDELAKPVKDGDELDIVLIFAGG
jgi:molybdopterin converting factor small subunit